MADGLVASDAAVEVGVLVWVGGYAEGAMGGDFFNHGSVAAEAVGFEDFGVAGFDADGFVEVLEGEGGGVVVAVGAFDEEFMEDVIVWEVAVVAGGDGVV